MTAFEMKYVGLRFHGILPREDIFFCKIAFSKRITGARKCVSFCDTIDTHPDIVSAEP